ncbi:MAG: YceI family protein [Balneolaceae bacterium]|nr:YceI family protein [Balneolaceae bacterium]MDR9447330.1 YceI family protein [Balneolaceae bacterium]
MTAVSVHAQNTGTSRAGDRGQQGVASIQESQQWITTQGEAKFISRAPLLEFEGVSEKLQGLLDLDENLVDFYIDLETLDTGIELRDKHMRDSYLETASYPFAEFTGTFLRMPDVEAQGPQSVTVTGEFKMHGVSRDITVDGELDFSDPNEIQLVASWKVLLSDYDIEIPKAVFYELDNEQEIVINATLEPYTP